MIDVSTHRFDDDGRKSIFDSVHIDVIVRFVLLECRGREDFHFIVSFFHLDVRDRFIVTIVRD